MCPQCQWLLKRKAFLVTDLIASVFRAILPTPVLVWLRGSPNAGGRKGSVRQRFLYDRRERLQLWFHQLRGGKYLDWYAKRLDSFAQTTRISSLAPDDIAEKRMLEYLATGYRDLDLLKGFGMKPEHKLHEIGVGQGRAAQFFVDYLEPGNYSGNDISQERLRMAEELLGLKHLDEKKPNLIVNRDNSFDWLDGRKVDFIWANAVFGHMPPEDVEGIIANIAKVMHETTAFYYTVRGATADTEVRRGSVKDWMRDHAFWENLAGRYNFQVELVDVELPADYVPRDARVMKLAVDQNA